MLFDKKVCIYTGAVDAGVFSAMERHAIQGCVIAFMDKDKAMGIKIKEELEKYQAPVFFFHGDIESEEDRDLFEGAVQELYGGADFFICKDK